MADADVVWVLVRERALVRVPAAVDAGGPDAVTAWLREHGWPGVGPDEWRVYYGPWADPLTAADPGKEGGPL